MAGHKNAWIKGSYDDGVFLQTGSLQAQLGGGIMALNTSQAEEQPRVPE